MWSRENMGHIILKIFVWLMMPVWVAIAAGMLLVPPAAVIWETYDMLTMTGTTTATVRKSEAVWEGEGWHPVIEYAYRVGGADYLSNRYLPGFFGNWGSWSGSGSVVRNYPVGKQVVIHYRPGEPAHSGLEFGWFKWSIGITLAFWGTGLAALLQRRDWLPMGGTGFSIPLPFLACILLVAIGPNGVEPPMLPWYALAFIAGGAVLYGIMQLYRLVRPG
jgi:hypothetical protein